MIDLRFMSSGSITRKSTEDILFSFHYTVSELIKIARELTLSGYQI